MSDSHFLLETFDALTEHLSRFGQQLNQLQPPAWVARSESEGDIPHLVKASSYYQDIWYQGEQDGRETRSCYGLLLAPASLLSQARLTNDAKDQFRLAVQAIQKNDKDRWLALKSQLNTRHNTLREGLYYQGLARVHLKQAYRHIPLLENRPEKIGFTWYCNGRSIKKLTITQAEKKLLAMGEEKTHIQFQLQKLNKLSQHEELAQIQNQVPVVRANLVFEKKENGQTLVQRKAMNVSLPILIPEVEGKGLPTFNEISEQPPASRTRIPRNDYKIEDEVYLPSLRVYRYK